MAEFVTPAILENHSVDEIYAKMRAMLPDDIDSSEGSHVWNFLRPTAMVVAELCEFVFPQIVQLIFPDWSYGEYLDRHAETRGIARREAVAASGQLFITGTAGAVIPEGSLFSTAATNDAPIVEYATTEAVTIGEDGTVSVGVQCTQTGTIGNTTTGTVVLVASRLPEVTAVTNPSAITGGTAEEDDDSLRERILEYDQSQGESFTGNMADYKRWALSVSGVGDATIIPAQDDTGLVTIILTDTDGAPATEDLCQAVYNYIMRPDDPMSRLAPVNAYLAVVPPATVEVAVRATVELTTDATLESVQAAFARGLTAYMPTALEDQEVKYTRVAAILSATEGVNDYSGLLIGAKGDPTEYGTSNLPVTSIQLPTVEEEGIDLISGIV